MKILFDDSSFFGDPSATYKAWHAFGHGFIFTVLVRRDVTLRVAGPCLGWSAVDGPSHHSGVSGAKGYIVLFLRHGLLQEQFFALLIRRISDSRKSNCYIVYHVLFGDSKVVIQKVYDIVKYHPSIVTNALVSKWKLLVHMTWGHS